jgi:lipopolysaccharide/colanic/teichoic acid biosynthesis glycosyltransferase
MNGNAAAIRTASATLPVREGLPRWVEAAVGGTALVIISPLLAMCAVAIVLTSRGPAIYRQERMGRGGKPFRICKFRSMRQRSESGTTVTAKGDNRITVVGRLLRKTKLDELPELWNIAKGDMSFVGPRPEVPEYVNLSQPNWRAVLTVRPGLTDPVTIQLRNEEELLASVNGNREAFYLQTLQPFKVAGYMAYLAQRTWWTDVKVIAATLFAIVAPHRYPPPPLETIVAASARMTAPARAVRS